MRLLYLIIVILVLVVRVVVKICYESRDLKYYQNCDTLYGNLLIVNISDFQILNYLQNLKKVTGYVLIENCSTPIVSLLNLKFIDGNNLYFNYSLAVVNNYIFTSNKGLKYIELPSLIEIRNGDILFKNNPKFCKNLKIHIEWNDILSSLTQSVDYYDDLPSGEDCAISCPEECSNGNINFVSQHINYEELQKINRIQLINVTNFPYCWSPYKCQIFTKIFCHQSCAQSQTRCSDPFSCCSADCKGICDQKNNQCLDYCKQLTYIKLNLSRIYCSNECNNLGYQGTSFYQKYQIKIPTLYKFGHLCVESCPENTFTFEDTCLYHCPFNQGYIETKDKKCSICVHQNSLIPECYKICYTIEQIFDHNLDPCEVYWGDIYLDASVLLSYKINNQKQLTKFFQNIKFITGSLHINNLPSFIKSLEFLHNLLTVYGQSSSFTYKEVLVVENTHLRYIGLPSLKLGLGKVVIRNNAYLCYLTSFSWSYIQMTFEPYDTMLPESYVDLSNNSQSNLNHCGNLTSNVQCDLNCDTSYGCLGPGPSHCIKCLDFTLVRSALGNKTICVKSCPRGYFTSTDTSALSQPSRRPECLNCHPECDDNHQGCHGEGPTNCYACRNYVINNQTCVSKCPLEYYTSPLTSSHACQACSQECYLGCSGPGTHVGKGGCNFCRNGAIKLNPNFTHCNSVNLTQCPPGLYPKWDSHRLESIQEDAAVILNHTQCELCHPNCAECFDATKVCPICKFARLYDAHSLQEWNEKTKKQTARADPDFSVSSSNHGDTNLISPTPLSYNLKKFGRKSMYGQCETSCPDGYYKFEIVPNIFDRLLKPETGCFKCSEQCKKSCTGPGPSKCLQYCSHYKLPNPNILNILTKALAFNHLPDEPERFVKLFYSDFQCVKKCPDFASFVFLNGTQSICLNDSRIVYKLSLLQNEQNARPKMYLYFGFLIVIAIICFGVYTAYFFGFCPFDREKRKKYDYTRCNFSGGDRDSKFNHSPTYTTDKKEYVSAENMEYSGNWPGNISSDYNDSNKNFVDGNASHISHKTQNANHLKSLTIQNNHRVCRVVQTKDLIFGPLLGSGAFGTVHKGTYKSPNGNISVAIKTLLNSCETAKMIDLIEEMGFLSRLEHPYILSFLGMCCESEIMIVTEFVELGNLLEFIRSSVLSDLPQQPKLHDSYVNGAFLAAQRFRKSSDRDSSLNTTSRLSSTTSMTIRDILNQVKDPPIDPIKMVLWCDQISQGMAYLEQNKIIHRDLAARNVLIKSLEQVIIADFGYARTIPNHLYASKGGKMPLKWLPSETIQTLVFTHQSDVWAYGVTAWEIFSFGENPYDGIPLKELANNLTNGYRLPETKFIPPFMYPLMRKCWDADSDKRPHFKEIHDRLLTFLASKSQISLLDESPPSSYENEDVFTTNPNIPQNNIKHLYLNVNSNRSKQLDSVNSSGICSDATNPNNFSSNTKIDNRTSVSNNTINTTPSPSIYCNSGSCNNVSNYKNHNNGIVAQKNSRLTYLLNAQQQQQHYIDYESIPLHNYINNNDI